MSFTGRVGHCCWATALVHRNAMSQRTLLMSALNLHFLDDRLELLHLALEDRVLLGGARAYRLGADVAQAVRRVGMLHRRCSLLLQPLDHRARRLRGYEEPVPAVGLEESEAELAGGRYLGQVGDALRGVGGERLDLSRLDVCQG